MSYVSLMRCSPVILDMALFEDSASDDIKTKCLCTKAYILRYGTEVRQRAQIYCENESSSHRHDNTSCVCAEVLFYFWLDKVQFLLIPKKSEYFSRPLSSHNVLHAKLGRIFEERYFFIDMQIPDNTPHALYLSIQNTSPFSVYPLLKAIERQFYLFHVSLFYSLSSNPAHTITDVCYFAKGASSPCQTAVSSPPFRPT